jgi:hypothetical protein
MTPRKLAAVVFFQPHQSWSPKDDALAQPSIKARNIFYSWLFSMKSFSFDAELDLDLRTNLSSCYNIHTSSALVSILKGKMLYPAHDRARSSIMQAGEVAIIRKFIPNRVGRIANWNNVMQEDQERSQILDLLQPQQGWWPGTRGRSLNNCRFVISHMSHWWGTSQAGSRRLLPGCLAYFDKSSGKVLDPTTCGEGLGRYQIQAFNEHPATEDSPVFSRPVRPLHLHEPFIDYCTEGFDAWDLFDA